MTADRDPPSRLARPCEASERGVREIAYAESWDSVVNVERIPRLPK